MADIQIDALAFERRAVAIISAWKDAGKNEDYEALRDVDALAVVVGGANEEVPYQKSSALHTWLLGYEFPSTMILITQEGFTFLTSASKAKLLEPLKALKSVKVEIVRRTKDDAQNKQLFEGMISRIDAAGSGKRIGLFPKDRVSGKFVDEWKAVYEEVKAKKGYEEVDVGPAVSAVWGPKDDEELKSLKLASRMSSAIISNYFVDEMSGILDEGKKITHDKLAGMVEVKLEDEKMWKKFKNLQDADIQLADWCYTPIIQSGGEYDLRTSAISSNKRLEGADGGGVVVASMGIKYKSYCSNIGRTYLIDPHRSQQKNYAFLLELQTEVTEKYLREGATAKDVYNKGLQFVQAKDSKLADSFLKNIGFAIGMEFRDSAYILSPKNNRKLKRDMVFNLTLGFSELPDPNHEGQTYSLLLIDTVRVSDGAAFFLTERVRSTNDMMFFFKDDEDDAPEKNGKSKQAAKPQQNVTATGKVLRNKTRGETIDESAAKRIKEHQRELARQKQEEGLARFAGEDGEGSKDKGKVFKKFESYKRDHMLPVKVVDQKIMVDQRAQSIVLPIYGFAVPFHVNTLKNVSKSDEGEYTYLRLNFITPGQIAGKKEDVPFDDPEATFIRSMSFRSTDSYHFAELYREISDLKKAATKHEAEKKEQADVVQQDKLIVTKGRSNRLPEVFARPGLDGKRVPGDLEIHQNGLRYQSPLKGEAKIDLLFNNMQHLFFQPCDKELIVLIHIHLKSPIMIGKKKAKDVQFYREASDVQFDETGNRKRKYRTGDEDEIELEQEERRRRSQLNKEFKHFAEKIAEASDGRVEVDVPFRELGFSGVPFRTNVLLQPTTDCLVHLTDPPFLVITLADVEIAHLERVQFGLKNFDLVFIFSDFTKPPMHINSIPTPSLDNVKEWLDSVDICVTEGAVNLNWSAIMKTVNEDPYDFFAEGGWGFLQADSDDEGGSSESESGSEFEDAEEAEGEVYSEEDDSGGSSFDSHASDDEGDGSDFDDDEEGEDWDELEKKAARADDRKARDGRGHGSEDEGGSGGKKGSSKGGKRR